MPAGIWNANALLLKTGRFKDLSESFVFHSQLESGLLLSSITWSLKPVGPSRDPLVMLEY